MLDSDLAKIYDIETKRINESVRRNQIKFPERFSCAMIFKDNKIYFADDDCYTGEDDIKNYSTWFIAEEVKYKIIIGE